MSTYRIRLNLEWDNDSRFYSVTSPDVPELFTYGRDLSEIQANVQDAIETLLDYVDSHGEARPVALQVPTETDQLELIVPVQAPIPA